MEWWRIEFKADGGETHLNTYRLVNNFLEAGFRVGRFIGLRGTRDTGLKPGDFVVGIDDPYSESLAEDLGEEYGMRIKPLKAVDQRRIAWLRNPLIGIYSGSGVSMRYLREAVGALFNMGFRRISLLPGPLTFDDLNALDALIVGDGDSFEMLRSLEREEAEMIKRFIESGGTYIGICAGALLPLKPINPDVSAYGRVEAWDELQLVECELLSDMVSESCLVLSGRRLNEVLRTYPLMGLVKSRIIRRGLLTLGYKGDISMFHTGPIVKILRARQVLGKMVLPSTNVEYGISRDEARRMIGGASSIALAEHGFGKIVLFFSHVESNETPFAHGLLGNAVLLRTYSDGRKNEIRPNEAVGREALREASESCRILRLVRDSAFKVIDQMDGIIPWLYAGRLLEEANKLSMLKQIMNSIFEEDVITDSIREFVKAEELLQELGKKMSTLPQMMVLSNDLMEWKYVISKARKALTPILEKIMKIQEMMADLSVAVVSSTEEEIKVKFDLLYNSIVGGRMSGERGISVSSGIVSPMISIVLNIQDYLEKIRFLRKILAYVQP